MAARVIFVNDNEFEILATYLKMRREADSLSLEHKIVFMRDKYEEKKLTYEQGYRDGMSCNHKEPQTFAFMGYTMKDLMKIIMEHEKDKFSYQKEIGRIFGVDYLYVEGQLKNLGYKITKIAEGKI